jgi:tetratricopeptide (TPR) repeat protein
MIADKPDVETETKTERLLELLDGLPLAIAQAGAYLQESGVGVSTYLRCYEEQWSNLMELKNETNPPLLDYPNRSVWTTWAISYEAVRRKDESTANLLILWSFLDNRDLWYRLFAAACQGSPVVAGMLFKWIGDIARSKLHFSKAMQLLRSFSLIEEVEDQGSHATHPVVHQWAYHCQDKNFSSELGRLAIATVGWAIPGDWSRNYSSLQGRLLPHAQAKAIRHQISWALRSSGDAKVDLNGDEETKVLLAAIRRFSIFYSDQGKRGEAEELSKLVLLKREEVLGPNHTLTLQMVNNLGNVQADQGKLSEAEQNYKRALRGFRALDPNHEWLLYTSNNLAVLYVYQGKLSVAEQLFEQALCGSEEANGLNHTITLQIVSNLGAHYANQGKLVAAKQMHERALRGLEEALGPSHRLTINTVGNLGVLYFNQGKLSQSEQMCKRALRGCEEALGPEDRLTLGIINNLGFIYAKQSKMSQLEKMYERALRGYEETLGGERIKTYRPALRTLVRMGSLYEKQEAFTKARSAYLRALPGYETLLGPSDRNCQQLRSMIAALRSPDEGLQYVPGLNVELLEMEDRKDNKRRKMS